MFPMSDQSVTAGMTGHRMETDPPLYFDIHLFVCCNRRPDDHPRGSCAAKGSEKLRDYMKARAKEMSLAGFTMPSLRINTAGCLDRCEQGPCLVIYPEGIWYTISSTEDVDQILMRHVSQGERIAELMLPAETAPQ
ncbi:Ferredoxin, 2Fe-2s [Granulibacter bethesdensis]|uniref:Ferredoxin, 2Fe-2s n=2 Tax=Granulibacter bethesdensis TaxID=364410 RepID=A0AAC9K8C2_9PROT|nr:Ferredoxin, 2Fe-2s [Granulibacter bethesdensis]APH60808.1 Ferredoxin, 2Fe-2s [Granulibacter bethesdensis]